MVNNKERKGKMSLLLSVSVAGVTYPFGTIENRNE